MELQGLILAGGKNRRMQGRFKGGLILGGETFLSILLAEMRKVSENILISVGDKPVDIPAGCQVVKDIYPGCGPMAGLQAGLAASHADLVLAAACDMPMLRAEFYLYLVDHFQKAVQEGKPCDGVVPLHEGRPEPLAAAYRATAAGVFEQALKSGQYRIRNALDRLHILYVKPDDVYIPMLQNNNDPQEYDKVCQTITKHNSNVS